MQTSFFSALIVTCECSRRGGRGGGVIDRKKGSSGNSKTAGRTVCVKGQEVDGP